MKSPETELPPANTRRWVPRRKAAVVAAVASGMLTIEEACRRYQMLEEELLAWQRAFKSYGVVGLRLGYVQQHRSVHPKARKTKKRGAATREASDGERLLLGGDPSQDQAGPGARAATATAKAV